MIQKHSHKLRVAYSSAGAVTCEAKCWHRSGMMLLLALAQAEALQVHFLFQI